MSPLVSPCSTPRKSRKSRKIKNPFSTRGLGKFSALLSELEEKKQKIYSQMSQDDISMVRFVYTTSNKCVPVVIKSKEKTHEVKKNKIHQDCEASKFSDLSMANSDKELKKFDSDSDKKPCKLKTELHRMKRPSYYLPISVILILVFLALFGRSLAILFTCVGWYIVPTIKSERSNAKIMMQKRNYVRRLSNNKGSFNQRTRRNDAVSKEKFPSLATRRRSF